MSDYHDAISGITVSKLDGVTGGIGKLIEVVKNMSGIDASSMSAFAKNLSSLGNSGLNNFVQAFADNSTNTKMSEAISGMMNKFTDGMKKKEGSVKSAASSSVDSALAGMRGKYADFSSAGSYLVDGFTKGISDNAFKAAAQAKAMAAAANEAARSELGVHSPSTVFAEIGGYVAEGFAAGISDNTQQVAKSTEELAQVGTEAAREVAESLKGSNSIFSDFAEKTDENGNKVEITLENAAKAFQSFRNSVKESVEDATGVFDEFEVETDITGGELLKNLQSQIVGITEWADNVQTLAGRGINEGLLKALSDMGPSGAKYANALVEMTDAELSNLNGLYAQRVGLNDKTANQIASSFLNGGKKINTAINKTLGMTVSAFSKFRDSIKESIEGATGAFDEFKSETDITGKELLKNLQSQIIGIKEWAFNIQALAGRGIDEGLLKALSEMGPSGAKYANALVTMTDAELKKLNSLYVQRIGLNDKAADDIASSFQNGGKKINASINATLKKAAEAFHSLRDSVKESVEGATGVLDEFKIETDVTGKELLKNLKSQIIGITEWASNIRILSDRGINKGLLKALSDMGPSGAKYVNALVTMSDKELKKLNKLYKKRLGLNGKTADKIAETFVSGGKKAAAAYGKGVVAGAKAVLSEVGGEAQNIGTKLVEGSAASFKKKKDKLKSAVRWTYREAVGEMKESLDYGKGVFQKFVNEYLSATAKAKQGNKAIKAASKAITAYGEKIYKESDYYKEDTANLKEHKKELSALQNKRKNLQKQLKKAQKSNSAASKARVKALRKELEENSKSISEAKKKVKADEKEIAGHTKEVFQNIRSSLADSVSSFLDPLRVSLESGVDLFKKFESNSGLYEADKKNLDEHKKSLAELERTQKNIQDEISKYADKNTLAARKRVKELKAQLSEVESSIEEAKKNIEQDENDMASHSEVTVDSILENMQSQITGVTKWQKNLRSLAGRGLSQGLLDKLKEMGADGVDYVDQFMNMTAEELQKANSLFAQSEQLTSQTLLNNFKDSLNTAKDWASGLQELARMGFSQDLLEKLGDMGVDGYDYIKAFLYMTPDQVAQFNKDFAGSLKLPNAIADQVISSYAYAGGQSVKGFMSAIGKVAESGSDENKALVTTAAKISEVIDTTLRPASKKTGKKAGQSLSEGISSKKKEAKTSSLELGGAALTSLKNVLSSKNGKEVSLNVIRGLKKGLSDGKSKVSAVARKVAQEAYDAAKSTLGINSPSKKFAELGEFVDDGFAKGLVSGRGNVSKTAVEVMGRALEEVSAIAGSGIDAQPTIRPVLDLSDIQNGASGIQKMMDGFSVPGSVGLARMTARAMGGGSARADGDAWDAIKKLQDTLTSIMEKPRIEQHNEFSITGSDPRAVADEVSHILQQQVERRSITWV